MTCVRRKQSLSATHLSAHFSLSAAANAERLAGTPADAAANAERAAQPAPTPRQMPRERRNLRRCRGKCRESGAIPVAYFLALANNSPRPPDQKGEPASCLLAWSPRKGKKMPEACVRPRASATIKQAEPLFRRRQVGGGQLSISGRQPCRSCRCSG